MANPDPQLIPARAPYLGPVATRCVLPGSLSTTFKQLQNETYHWMRETVSAVALVYGGWYAVSGAETALGGSATLTASVQGPDGVRKQVTFGGATSGTIPNLGLLVSDLTPVTAPINSELLVRSFWTSATGVLSSSIHRGPKDKMNYAVSGLSDLTMSGNVSDGAGTNICSPIAILGYTRRGTVFLAGDSIEFGYGEPGTADTPWGDFGIVARYFGPSVAYIHGGIPSASLAVDNAGGYTNRLALSQYCSHIVVQLGGLDMNGTATTAATFKSARTTFAGKFSGKPVIGCTIGPFTSSTDSWATVANQTLNSNNTAINAANDFVRAGIPGECACLDINAALSSSWNSGKWAVGMDVGATSGTALTADGVHPNTLGNDRPRRILGIRPSDLVV